MVTFKQDKTVVLGYVPIRRDAFPVPTAAVLRDDIKKTVFPIFESIEDLVIVGIDDIIQDGMLWDQKDIGKVVDKLRAAKVDAVFFPHCNFGQEEVVSGVAAELKKPVLLWGPRDPNPEESGGAQSVGPRAWDTQCGLFATGRALSRSRVPFTYIENCWLDSPLLKKGIDDFVRVASVVKAFRGMRVAQIGTRPRPFHSVIINESELVSKFGIEIVPIWPEEVLEYVEKVKDDPRISEVIEDIKQTLNVGQVAEEILRKIATLEVAILDLCENVDATALAMECWRFTNNAYGVASCFLYGELFDKGLPAACETDLHAAVGARLLQAAARYKTAPFIADLTIRHPSNDNAELLWHCGPFAKQLIKDGIDGTIIDGRGTYEIKGGPITVVRFDQEEGNYQLFADEGKGVEGPKTGGNYVWFETNNWSDWEKKLVYGPYIHHVTGVHGNYAGILKEATKYFGGVTHDSVNPIKYD